ncbi:type II secretion system F family protein [Streptomyces sp. NRRL F-5123]|uniref:type II secretion system F family protein n=1 Tax=Streptomyces sp. NRRL F-5123 TaxID=1463856 RepID=UPI00099CEC2B
MTGEGQVVWAAVLCAAALLAAGPEGGGARRRARRVLGGVRAERASGRAGPGERLRVALAGLRGRVEGYARGGPGRYAWAARVARRAGPEALCVPAGAALALLTRSVLPLLAGPAALPLVGRALRRRARRAAAERGAAAVAALCGALAGELRAGRPPHTALGETIGAAGWQEVAELSGAARLLLSAARFGGDVPRALRDAAGLSAGTEGLTAVAACWQVAVDGGAGLAAALDRVAAALRAEADQREDLRAQLAGPRSTAVLLALLPLFGVVLGAGLGADPARVLLHTPAGLLCLLAGGVLEWAGLAWTARIMRAAGSPAVAGPEHGVGEPVEPHRRAEGRSRMPGGADALAVGAVGVGGVVHSLGTAVVAAVAAGGAVAAGLGSGRRKRARRLVAVLGGPPVRRVEPGRLRRAAFGAVRRWGAVPAAGLVAGAAAGGALGVLVGPAAALAAGWWLRGRRRAAAGRTTAAEPGPGHLPLCADLMAACLAAGATPGEAAGAVGECLGGPLGAALIRAQAELRLGGDPVECWLRFGGESAARELGRCLARASTTGSAPVAEMARLAAELRAARGRTAQAAARRAAVVATAPLGLCFLPAFLLVGVVPVVIGLAGAVLGPAAP